MNACFAYGSNMSREAMGRRCPGAHVLGRARLDGWGFIITADGYASIRPHPGRTVHGVLWRVGPRELAALNAYESVASGLYRRCMLPVCQDGKRRAALIYIGRDDVPGRPRPGYLQIVIKAARDWDLPNSYIRELARWSGSDRHGVRAVETGALA
ncbi:MAG: gamma-glutamylcyclotransferase family protein [Xanthobacteraceae bacterium]